MAEDLASLRSIFADPPREYTSGPLWVWNDMLTEEQIVSTLEDLVSQGVKQAFVHPRPGLMTPYLSEDWFRLWKKALETAERLDMNIWIYDENSYPSGFAGGFVPEALPDSRAQGLVMEDVAAAPAWADDMLAVYRKSDGGSTNVTDAVRRGDAAGDGPFTVVRIALAGSSPWYGGWWYVDLLKPGVTQKFLDVTLGAYEREIGDRFGKRMPGSFTDEPHLKPVGQFHWTADLPEQFQKRWGYDLMEHLPSLLQPVGDWRRVRHNYYQTLCDLFVDRWAKPYYDYCEAHHLDFTGHYWEHEWPNCTSIPDNMAMYAWHQRPAIDCLFNRYGEDVRAQFGNTRSVLELASVANQLGRRRTLCEAYGGGGWDMRFEDMKRIGDWLFVLGVNTMDEHLSRISMRGARKADYPPSFSYHATWWDSYHVVSNYFTRLAAALSHGKQINDILVLEPTTTAWMYQTEPAEPRTVLGDTFQKLVVDLAQAQVEFDIGSEDIIADRGSVTGNGFIVGERTYHTVVVPALTENLNAKTVALLEAYVGAGGVVFACGDGAPAYIDGTPSDRVATLAKAPSWKTTDAAALAHTLLDGQALRGPVVRRDDGDLGILYHHRRQFEDGEVLYLVNTSLDHPSRGTVEGLNGVPTSWDLETGETGLPYETTMTSGNGTRTFDLAPGGSLLLSWARGPLAPSALVSASLSDELNPVGPPQVSRVEPNVLILDYLDLACKGQELDRVYYARAAEFVFQQHGLENNPWDHAVQFKDNLISKTFPADSGFTATYRFTIGGDIPADLRVVVERPDLYTIACNGHAVTAIPGAWWFDKQFGVISVAKAATAGENTLTLTATPFTMFHEIAAVFVLGDFALDAGENGFTIAAPRAMTLGPWNEQGMPLYGDAVVYTEQFDIADPAEEYRVTVPEWYGSVAEVFVNGEPAGHIWHQPWERTVSGLKAGVNTVEVRVTGTPKNTFGPHHGDAGLGLAGPGNFRQGPEPGPPAGTAYDTIGYGIFAPFTLAPVE